MRASRVIFGFGVVLGFAALAAACSETQRSFAPPGEGDDAGEPGMPDDEGQKDDATDPGADAAADDDGPGPGPGKDPDAGPMMTSCAVDEDCDDENTCNGAEVCRDNACYAGTRGDDGVACTIPDGVGKYFCEAGNCSPSRCGDDVLDTDTEACDDGNLVNGDGCEPDCTFSCNANPDCDDSNVCNGDEVCDLVAHACVAGTAVRDGTVCGADRSCRGGRCVPAGCGDGNADTGEECDDGNQVLGDGCDDCTYSCVKDEQCDDQNQCNGTETCDLTTHVCAPGVPKDCNDKNACTTDSCLAETGECQSELIDADGDRHASQELGACGDDCDDNDPAVYTGAEELCDNRDNNCNDAKDETAPTYYVDCDGDGFAAKDAVAIQQCDVPPAPTKYCELGQSGQWVNTAPSVGTTDCWDLSPNVRPMTATEANSAWSFDPIADRTEAVDYDYNCDELEEPRITNAGVSASANCGFVIGPPIAQAQGLIIKFCPGAAGYTGRVAPPCGKSADYTYCTSGCDRVVVSQQQSCR